MTANHSQANYGLFRLKMISIHYFPTKQCPKFWQTLDLTLFCARRDKLQIYHFNIHVGKLTFHYKLCFLWGCSNIAGSNTSVHSFVADIHISDAQLGKQPWLCYYDRWCILQWNAVIILKPANRWLWATIYFTGKNYICSFINWLIRWTRNYWGQNVCWPWG